MTLLILCLCVLFQGRSPNSPAKPVPVEATKSWVLPDSDLTGKMIPYRARTLLNNDSRGSAGIQNLAFDSSGMHDEILVFRDTIARRTIQWTEPLEVDLLSRLAEVRTRITEVVGAPIDSFVLVDNLDSVLGPTNRESWNWSVPEGRIRLDLLQPAFGKTFHPRGTETNFAPAYDDGSMDIQELVRDTTLPAGQIRVTTWNRLSRISAALAMSECLRKAGCDLPTDLGSIVPGSDTIMVSGENLAPEWLPEIQDTFRRENSRFLEGTFGSFDELVGYGNLDSSFDLQILTPLAGPGYRKTILDSFRLWNAEAFSESLKERYDEIWKNLSSQMSDSSKESIIRDLPDAFEEVLGILATSTSKTFLDSLDHPTLLVRKRPALHPWPLTLHDITQSFKPIARRPTRSKDLPEHHALGVLSNFEDDGLQQVVFVDGKTEQRSLTYSFTVSGLVSMRLDSVHQDNLRKLRIEFGHEERTTIDTISSSDKTELLVDTRWWHRGNARIRLERYEEFVDTGEYRRAVEDVLRKLPSVDPSMDSSRLEILRKDKLGRLSEHSSQVMIVRLFLSNPVDPSRFARAMADCLEDKDCNLPMESGFSSSGDSLYAISPEIPANWFPKGGPPVVKRLDDSAFALRDILISRKSTGFASGTHGFERLEMDLELDSEGEFRKIADSLVENLKRDAPVAESQESPFDSLYLSEYGGTLAHSLAATCKFYTRISSLAVFRIGTPTHPDNLTTPSHTDRIHSAQ